MNTQILKDIHEEVMKAESKHKPMNSFHEAYAVILEEADELWDEIKRQNKDRAAIRVEAIQTAAMCVRLVNDLL